MKLIESVGGIKFNKSTVVFASFEPYLVCNDVTVVEQLYTTHNAAFDKHPSVQNITMKLTGHSILFDESSTNWRARRKAMAPAFYKGKLQGLVRIAET